ncbi:MAG: immunity protein 32 [Magnetococcales bacterium]|nr:immunity protein 32 [Magnetococcales bacterium]
MKDDLLVFELNKDGDQLFIHGDPTGLRRLAQLLECLAVKAENGDFPHDHLFSEEWGGSELSVITQEDGNKHLNHVKIYGWPNSNGSAPYKVISEIT